MHIKLNYKDYNAIFGNNVLNIYHNNKFMTSKAYSNIVYEDEIKNIFENTVKTSI